MYRRGQTWWTKLVTASGRRKDVSLGTTNEKTARAIEASARTLRATLDPHGVLDMVVDGRITMADVFRLGAAGAAHKADAEKRDAEREASDLRQHIAGWQKALLAMPHGHGGRSAAKYAWQLAQLYPGDEPLYPEALTVSDLWRRLEALPVAPQTRARYRAAASSFFRHCVKHGVLAQNPARGIEGLPSSPGRVVWYSPEDAQRLVAHLTGEPRGLEALMAGTGMEWQAIERVRAGDIDLTRRTVLADGGKTPWRRRVVRITEAWTLPWVEEAMAGKESGELLFTLNNKAALAAHHNAVRELKLEPSRLHDWRHSYAIWLLQRGELPQVVAHQLGHSNTNLVWSRYGKYAVGLRDYRSLEGVSA